GVVMRGFVADDVVQDALLLDVRGALGSRVEDRIHLVPGEIEENWKRAVLVGIVQLQALDSGEMTLKGHHLLVQGRSQYPRLNERFQAVYRAMLPKDYRGSAEIEVVTMEQMLPKEVEACSDRFAEMLQGQTIEFIESSSVMRPTSIETIDRLAEVFRACTGTRLEISVHTRPKGDVREQLQLSRKRAETIAGLMRLAGIEASRLMTRAYGSFLPPGNEADGESQQADRVEFRFQPQATKGVER
ncbi:MAG TPA: OmpA family protein, partial [Chromatiales bacterium]|nr:OmpA family protein [Chromatiales bacterium]